MRFFGLLAPVFLICSACGGFNDESGTKRINGAVHIVAGQPLADAATVNGPISVDDKAVFGSADTVNGDVWVGAGAAGSSVKTVNGSITLDGGARVSGEIYSLNGTVTLNKGAQAGAKLSTLNGTITINDAHVAGGIATVVGNVNINGQSRIEGGINVHKLPVGLMQAKRDAPWIMIGPGATVQGKLRFEQDVKLYVSDKASVGPISGATAISFSGDKPIL